MHGLLVVSEIKVTNVFETILCLLLWKFDLKFCVPLWHISQILTQSIYHLKMCHSPVLTEYFEGVLDWPKQWAAQSTQFLAIKVPPQMCCTNRKITLASTNLWNIMYTKSICVFNFPDTLCALCVWRTLYIASPPTPQPHYARTVPITVWVLYNVYTTYPQHCGHMPIIPYIQPGKLPPPPWFASNASNANAA